MVDRVLVATHVGMPFESARTNPEVDDATRESVVAAEAYKMSPGVYEAMLVPPLPTGSVPVTSVVSETVAHDATPAPLRERTN
jgi:hypothetical protein